MGMVLVTVFCTVLQTSIQSLQALCLWDLIPWIYLSLLLYSQSIWFRSYLNDLVVFPTFFNLSLNFAIRSSWSEPKSDHMPVVGLTFKKVSNWFPKWSYHFTFPPEMYESSSSTITLSTLGLVSFKNFRHSNQYDLLEKTLMLGKIAGRREEDSRGIGWMASPTQWTWVWANSGK